MADTIQKYLHLIFTVVGMLSLLTLIMKFFFEKSYFQWIPVILAILIGGFFVIYYAYQGIKYQWFDGDYNANDITSGLGLAGGILTLIAGIMLFTSEGIPKYIGYSAGVMFTVSFFLLIPQLIKAIMHPFKD